jgi:hypothetical protein
MPTVPEPTKSSLAQKLTARARTAWPRLAAVHLRHRGQFAYVDGELANGESIKLMRLRTADPPAPGASRSTSPAPTSTRTPSCPPAASPAGLRTHWTSPAASTSPPRSFRDDQTPGTTPAPESTPEGFPEPTTNTKARVVPRKGVTAVRASAELGAPGAEPASCSANELVGHCTDIARPPTSGCARWHTAAHAQSLGERRPVLVIARRCRS